MRRAIGLFFSLLLIGCAPTSFSAVDSITDKNANAFKETFKTYSFEKQWQIYLKDVKRRRPGRSDFMLVMAGEGSPMAHFIVGKMMAGGGKPNDAYTFGYTIIQFMPRDVVCPDKVLMENLKNIITLHGDVQRLEYLSRNCSAT